MNLRAKFPVPAGRIWRRIALAVPVAVALLLAAIPGAWAAPIITPATHVILMDYESGQVLFEKNADAAMKPASMAKLMTIYLLFDAVKSGRISMEDRFTVSRKAYGMGGSRMFLEQGEKVRVADLMRGIIVQSGNDASVVVAEAMGGSEDAFADEMTRTARALGMVNTTFGNATGWPDEETVTTARDIAILARAIIMRFPELYAIYSEKNFTHNGIKQGNRNPLLYTLDIADGLKTGYTEESGYGLAASAVRRGQRFILVFNGLGSKAERRSESTRLMEFAFNAYARYTLLDTTEPLGQAPVRGGVAETVPIHPAETLTRMMLAADFEAITREVVLEGEISAPVEKGTPLGEVALTIGGEVQRYPVVAGETVRRLPIHLRIKRYLEVLIFGPTAPPPAE